MDESLRLQARTARASIEAGRLRGEALLDLVLSVPFVDRDPWVDELLGIEPPPEVPPLPRGSVPYLPCGVDEIIAMVRDIPLRPDDELVDLGSGLGRPLVVAHLLSGARCRGIEIHEPLVRSARALCKSLDLPDITFVHADASESALDGSVFFLYAPFNGEMLARVVRRLEEVARRRRIVVATVGLELRDVAWLEPRSSSNVSLSLYESKVERHG